MLEYYEARNDYWKGKREPPASRRVESRPYSARGVKGVVLHDRSRISRPMTLVGGELAAAQMMNGKRSFNEIYAELSKKVPQHKGSIAGSISTTFVTAPITLRL